jgi:hypothetical protein
MGDGKSLPASEPVGALSGYQCGKVGASEYCAARANNHAARQEDLRRRPTEPSLGWPDQVGGEKLARRGAEEGPQQHVRDGISPAEVCASYRHDRSGPVKAIDLQ